MSGACGRVLPSLLDCDFPEGRAGELLSKESSLEAVRYSIEVGALSDLLEPDVGVQGSGAWPWDRKGGVAIAKGSLIPRW